MQDELDLLVVGAGQAGLATGRLLTETGFSFRLQERHRRVGDSWRERYGSLVLFSSRAYSALPGLTMDGKPDGYPTKDEIADYLQRYAEAFRLPVNTADGVIRLERDGDRFVAITEKANRIVAKAVILTTGGFQEPVVPAFARQLSSQVFQLTAKTYRNPAQLPPGRVLVVGSGASGRQLAEELAATHETWLSTGSWISLSPQRFLGKDIIWWFDHIGALDADKESLYGRLIRRLDSTPGLNLTLSALRRRGVHTAARTTTAEGVRVHFADGASEEFSTVIWALGYRDDSSLIAIPEAVDEAGRCIEQRGVSAAPGIFYVGRSWQNTRSSALVCGVAKDAAVIVDAACRYISGHEASARARTK